MFSRKLIFRHWIIWALWLAMWAMVSTVAVAADGQSQCESDVKAALLQRLPYAQASDCQVNFIHPEQWKTINHLLSLPGYSGACDLQTHRPLLGRVIIPYVVSNQGQVVQRFSLGVNTSVDVPVVILKNAVSRGSILTESDLVLARQSVARVPYQSVRSVKAVLGMQARMPLVKGSLLMPWMLVEQTVVYCNDPVQILCEGPSLLLKVAGMALQDGALHDRIRVKNIDSQKILLAEVLDDKKVRVTSGAQ